MNQKATPERSTAAAFPRYLTGQVVADSVALRWPGFYAWRWRHPRVVDTAPAFHGTARRSIVSRETPKCAAASLARNHQADNSAESCFVRVLIP